MTDHTNDALELLAKYQGRRALSIEEILNCVPFSRSTLFEVFNSKQLTARKLGRRTIVLIDDLEAFLRSLPPARR